MLLDIIYVVVTFVSAENLQTCSLLSREWRAAVAAERRRRKSLPRIHTLLMGGAKPDLGTFIVKPPIIRNHVVGSREHAPVPSPPIALAEASAVVLDSGVIVLGGRKRFDSRFECYAFDPISWKWIQLPGLCDRDRRCVTLCTDDGSRVLAIGGFVGVDWCNIPGDNACTLVDVLDAGSKSWRALEDLNEAMINPVVAPYQGMLNLVSYRGDDDDWSCEPSCWPSTSVTAFEDFHYDVRVCNGMWISSDLFLVAAVVGDDVKCFACHPNCDWVDVGSLTHPELLHAEGCQPPTIALLSDTVLVSAVFWDDDDDDGIGLSSSVGWRSAKISELEHCVNTTGAAPPEWCDVTREVGTPVREGCAAVVIPRY